MQMMRIRYTAALWLALLAGSAAAFPFWLNGPTGRSNPHDPASPLYVPPATLPVTPLATPTWTNVATATNAPTATSVPTSGGGTPTASPTVTPTRTATAVPPTATASPTAAGIATPTATATPGGHSSLVANFEDNTNNAVDLWSAPILTVKDAYAGTTQSPNPWVANSGTAGGAYGASNYCGCFSGHMLQQVPPTYPYAYLGLELTPGGSASGGPGVDVTAYSPNQGLQFDYKAAAAGVAYRVQLATTEVTDSGYYEFDFTPADTAWHTLTVYFPGQPGATNSFAQPAWAAQKPFDITQVGAVMFSPMVQTSAAVDYSLCVDNVTFAVAAAPTPPALTTGTPIMNFEDNLNNNLTLAPFSQTVDTGMDTYGTTMVNNPWTASSGTLGGAYGTSAYCGRINGTLVQQVPASNIYPFAVMELQLALNGYGNGGGKIDVTPYAPNQRLVFDYKGAAAGVSYGVQLVTQNIADYSFWEYDFTAADTNWHTVVVYFPGAAFTPRFTRPTWGANQALVWDPTQVGEVLYRVIPQNSGPVNYDLSVDNVHFD